jgi:crossover junction endodeoxyribonuclease RusA
MKAIVIRLPFPSAELFPNRKNGRKYEATREFKNSDKQAGYILTVNQTHGFSVPEGNIPLSLVFVQPDGRHRDLDNMLAASKALLDGMATALGVDDKRFRPIQLDTERGEKPGALLVAVGYEVVK